MIKSAAEKLIGQKRRAYQAEVTVEFFGGGVRGAEKEMGWGRETVRKGMREAETGISCYSGSLLGSSIILTDRIYAPHF